MQACLPPDVYKGFVDRCGENVMMGPGFGRINARTGKESVMDIMGPPGPRGGSQGAPLPRGHPLAQMAQAGQTGGEDEGQGRKPNDQGQTRPAGPPLSYPADRRVMRDALLKGLPSPHYGKALVDYTVTPTGVTAHFSDGTTSPEGSLLVGAEGIYSYVAAKLIGNKAAPIDTGVRLIYGKTPVSNDLMDKLLPSCQKGVSLIEDKQSSGGLLMLFMEVMKFHHPETPPNYIYWVMTGDESALGKPNDELLKMNGEEAAAVSIMATSEWLETIQPILKYQASENTAILKMTTSNPKGLPDWKTDRRVTVMGDAVHAMPPTGGSGANTALRDAELLSKTLAEGLNDGDGWSVDVINKYEDEMREYAGEMVAMSYGVAIKSFGVKPLAEAA